MNQNYRYRAGSVGHWTLCEDKLDWSESEEWATVAHRNGLSVDPSHVFGTEPGLRIEVFGVPATSHLEDQASHVVVLRLCEVRYQFYPTDVFSLLALLGKMTPLCAAQQPLAMVPIL